MDYHIWYLVLALYIFINLEAYAAGLSDYEFVDKEPEDTAESISFLSNNTLQLKCPETSDDVEWRLLDNMTVLHNSSTLEIKEITLLNKGTYACYVKRGEHYELVKKYNVTIYEPPYFLKKMSKVMAKPAGNTAKLTCKTGGYPTPNITWYKDGQTPLRRELGDVRIHHWSLTLEDLIPVDKGEYECVACNIAGCINFTYYLDVIERYPSKPYIKDGYPQNITAPLGGPAVFECPQILADLEPFIEWIYFKNESSEADFVKLNKTKDNTDPQEYIISNVTYDDEGWYACIAANALGRSMSKAYLRVVDEVIPIFIKLTPGSGKRRRGPPLKLHSKRLNVTIDVSSPKNCSCNLSSLDMFLK